MKDFCSPKDDSYFDAKVIYEIYRLFQITGNLRRKKRQTPLYILSNWSRERERDGGEATTNVAYASNRVAFTGC